jgi:hypothetical protein
MEVESAQKASVIKAQQPQQKRQQQQVGEVGWDKADAVFDKFD